MRREMPNINRRHTGSKLAAGTGKQTGRANIFQLQNTNTYRHIGSIPTRNGAQTSLPVPELNLFLAPGPSVYTHDGELMVYQIQK